MLIQCEQIDIIRGASGKDLILHLPSNKDEGAFLSKCLALQLQLLAMATQLKTEMFFFLMKLLKMTTEK